MEKNALNKTMKKLSKKQIISKIFIIIGICLFCYPTVFDIYNASIPSSDIEIYQKNVNTINEDKYNDLIKQAKRYNEYLVNNPTRYLSSKDLKSYLSILDITGTGIMGVISISKINVKLPIYHTTDDKVLQIGVGHVTGTSFPIGGKSTHTVISGHRGMPFDALFTNLPKLVIGDTFQITVLKEKLTYEVDQIQTVLPDEIEKIEIIDGEDYCTLVTCTPLGINTHRLLVRGHRILTPNEVTEEEYDSIITKIVKGYVLSAYDFVLLGFAIVLFFLGFFYPLVKNIIKKRRGK